MSKTDKLKELLKDKKPTFGTNPSDPWSAKANIDEKSI